MSTLLNFIKNKNKRGLFWWIRYYYFNFLDVLYKPKEKEPSVFTHNPKVNTTYPTKNWTNLTEKERIEEQFKHFKSLNLFFKT